MDISFFKYSTSSHIVDIHMCTSTKQIMMVHFHFRKKHSSGINPDQMVHFHFFVPCPLVGKNEVRVRKGETAPFLPP
jgi:hypothetical protein